ncbi:MAG: hypothetical protein M8467_03590 [Anaerolineae bacterium]|nr:hypothetical protein [Anaerolineae bacterium]
MRNRSLLTLTFLLIALLALGLVASGIAFGQGTAPALRPTATPAELPEGYKVRAPEDPEALPDLVVASIQVFPTSPYVNQGALVQVTVKNVGTADVAPTNNTFLDLYINPPTDELLGIPSDHYWDVQGYLMAAGASATFEAVLSDVFTDTASYNLWAQVDTPHPPEFPTGQVLESDEINNILGPKYVTVRTHFSWVEKDHVDFFSNMASTLDVVPVVGTVGIITNTPGLEISGDSALALGIFDEPPSMTSWGTSASTDDYNMIHPDTKLNQVIEADQRFPYLHAEKLAGGEELVVAVWEDGRDGPIFGKDIYLRWSKDGGDTWANEQKVNDDVGYADQKHPTVAVAPNGTIVVAWQDHRDASFDIYVQPFTYNGVSLVRVGGNFRVDTGAKDLDQILPDIAVDQANNFYVAWQDLRNGNDDIFAVRSYYSPVPCPTVRTDLAFLPEGTQDASPSADYLCWGGDRRISDDPTTTKQASPSISAIESVRVTEITCEPVLIDPGPPPVFDVVVTVDSEPASIIAVTWEDYREGANDPDIYLTYSDDDGETFGVDQRLNDDKPANTNNSVQQGQSAVALTQWMKWLTLTCSTPYGDAEAQVEVPVATMHVAWQDFRNSTPPEANNNPDIYYDAVTLQPDTQEPWPIVLSSEGQRKVNDNDQRAWQSVPVWQGEPDVAARGTALTLAESVGYNAYVVWADGRNYGGELKNEDIYFRLISNVGEPSAFVGGNNVMLNDNVRLHNFDPVMYDSYRLDMPPHARQRNPAIASTLTAEWPTITGGYVYAAWEDDRLTNPSMDRNIYFARSNLLFGGHRRIFDTADDPPGEGERYASGAFVSQIFDSSAAESIWYMADWHATTDSGTYITVQTRLGNTREEVLSGDWYPERFPYPDDALGPGAPLQGYDAPGQHIEDAAGDYWPQARFIQYRVNFWARNAASLPGIVQLNTPFLFDVILHYDRPPIIYLPIVFRSYP